MLPKIAKDNITTASTKFINDAVVLKNALIEERAVYQFFWVCGGEALNPDSIRTSEGDKGVVSMCTFPGLMRKVKQEDMQLVINVVKANAKSINMLNRRY